MKIAVTGASGFIGKHLTKRLKLDGHQVVAVQRAEITKPHTWIDGIDVLIHLAGIAHTSGISQLEYEKVNCDLPVALARSADNHGVKRFVFVSSSHAESHQHTAYGASKAKAERTLLSLNHPEIVVVRPTLVYGIQAKGNFKTLLRLAQLPVPLPLGGISAKRSMVFVENLVDALLFASTTPSLNGKIFTVTDPDDALSLSDIVGGLRRASSRRTMIVDGNWVPYVMRLFGARRAVEKVFGAAEYDGSALVKAGWRAPYTSTQAFSRIVASTRAITKN